MNPKKSHSKCNVVVMNRNGIVVVPPRYFSDVAKGHDYYTDCLVKYPELVVDFNKE